MRRCHVEGELLNQSRESRRLSLGKLHHEAGQRRGVDYGVLERALQTAADEPCVEGVVAVLDQHGAVGETQERTARVAKLRRSDEHRAVDVVAPVGVRIDRRLTVDQGVEERKRPVEPKPLGAHLEDEERRVPGRLDVEGDELRLVKPGLRPHLGCVDGDLLPRNGLHGPTGLEKYRLRAHLDSAIARRAQLISSWVNPRNRTTATP